MYIRRPMCLLAVVFLLFLSILIEILGVIPKDYDSAPEIEDGEMTTVVGEVESKEEKFGSISVKLSNVSYLSSNQDKYHNLEQGVILYLSDDSNSEKIKTGAILYAKGKFSKFETAENEGQFNKRKYYYIQGYCGALKDAVPVKVTKKHSYIHNMLDNLRDRTCDIIDKYCVEPDKSSILKALTLGDRTDLSAEVKDMYQNAGIAHILSLSGLHIAIVGMGILKFAKALCRKIIPIERISVKITDVIAMIPSFLILVLYCLMTRMSVSTVRAMIMFILMVAADLFERTYDLLSAAAFSSIIACVINPLYLYDSGFELSFAAVISVGIILPVLNNCMKHLSRMRIISSLTASISVTVGTLPIVAFSFYQVPLIGILLNLVVIPLMSVILFLGFLISILGHIPGGFIDNILTLAGKIVCFILDLYERLASLSEYLPFNVWVIGEPEMWQIVIYYVILALVLILLGLISSQDSDRKRDEIHWNRKKRYLVATCVLPLMAVAFCVLSYHPHPDMVIRNLSVGQGDCAIISCKGANCIVDCGSTTVKEVGKNRLIPCLKSNGISYIDAIYISHPDTDHVSGIIELLSDSVYRRRIGKVFVSGEAFRLCEGEIRQQTLMLTSALDIPVIALSADSSINELNKLSVSVISPIKNETYSDTNDASLVLRFVEPGSGFTALFTGDMGMGAERLVLDNIDLEHIRADYLKVAHHGSRNSSSSDFIRASSPKVAVISVGRNNSYGHPHKETLEELKLCGARIYRTDFCGECITSVDSGRVELRTFLHP